MREAFPFVPLGGHVRVGIAIFSYDGGINFGVTGDRDTADDIDVLCRGIEGGVAELLGTAADEQQPVPTAEPAGEASLDPTSGSSTAR
jgi:hypothetical protein